MKIREVLEGKVNWLLPGAQEIGTRPLPMQATYLEGFTSQIMIYRTGSKRIALTRQYFLKLEHDRGHALLAVSSQLTP